MNDADEEKLQKNRKLCRQFIELSPKIRYVGLMNNFGRTISGQLRKGVIPLFSPDEARDENFLEATRNQLRKKFEKAIGKTRFTITENEKKSARGIYVWLLLSPVLILPVFVSLLLRVDFPEAATNTRALVNIIPLIFHYTLPPHHKYLPQGPYRQYGRWLS